MPRFENEDFDPKKRNREDIDRTVPKDEDYYNYSPEDIDLNFNSKKREDNIVVDNQRKPGNYGDYQQDSRGDITFKRKDALSCISASCARQKRPSRKSD